MLDEVALETGPLLVQAEAERIPLARTRALRVLEADSSAVLATPLSEDDRARLLIFPCVLAVQ
jgi:hypothetical protein